VAPQPNIDLELGLPQSGHDRLTFHHAGTGCSSMASASENLLLTDLSLQLGIGLAL
jgi:hypothetical protein